MEYSCITDIGIIREKNQDSFLAISNEYGDFLALVSDGIGGGKAGEVASGETIKYFEEAFRNSGPFSDLESAKAFVEYHVETVNKKVYGLSRSVKDYEGMGTTLTGLFICKHGKIALNVGDSRVYGIEGKNMHQLTYDHTLVNHLLATGQISYEESINHPKRHYLVRAIGIYDEVAADVFDVDDYEYYLICSDGLYGYMSEDEISDIIYDDERSIAEKCEDLKDLSLLKGGYDNVTIILIRNDENV